MNRASNKTNQKNVTATLPLKNAISLLRQQYDKGKKISEQFYYPNYEAWQNTTREYLIKAFGSDSGNVENFIKSGRIGSFPLDADATYWLQRYSSCLISQLIMLGSAIEQLETQAQLEEPNFENESLDALHIVERICTKFHRATRQLSERHSSRQTLTINDEYDVQDLLHTFLKLFFDDIRPEESTPSYAGKSSRVDFLLKNESIVVEVKMTRVGLSDREIGNQLIEDITRYKTHPDCKTLVCFVYDPEERISNPNGLEKDLSQENNGMHVKVIITPKK